MTFALFEKLATGRYIYNCSLLEKPYVTFVNDHKAKTHTHTKTHTETKTDFLTYLILLFSFTIYSELKKDELNTSAVDCHIMLKQTPPPPPPKRTQIFTPPLLPCPFTGFLSILFSMSPTFPFTVIPISSCLK